MMSSTRTSSQKSARIRSTGDRGLRARLGHVEDECENLRVQLEDAQQNAHRFGEMLEQRDQAIRALKLEVSALRASLENVSEEKAGISRSGHRAEKLAHRLLEQEEELRTSNEELLSVCEELRLAQAALENERSQLAENVEKRTKELQRERDLLQAILEISPESVVITDPKAAICNVSPNTERMFGFTDAELRGQDISLLIPGAGKDNGPFPQGIINAKPDALKFVDVDIYARRKDGSLFPIDIALGETHFDGRHVSIFFIRDVTARTEYEEERRKLHAEVAHAGRLVSLGEMTTSIAHEINQPLAAISNYASVCGRLMDGEDPPLDQIKETHARITEQIRRIDDMVRHFRSFVRPGGGRHQPINLNDTVKNALAVALVGRQDFKVETEVRLVKHLPHVLANPLEVQQVVVNLVRNAMEAMAEVAERRLVIRTRNLRSNNSVEFVVEDNGPGLRPEVKERLFEPFVTTKDDGVGIGLSLCRTIIESHDGRIWAESNGQRGCTFRFTLPAAASRPEDGGQ